MHPKWLPPFLQSPQAVTLDANNMMAGKTLTFTLTLVDIQRAD